MNILVSEQNRITAYTGNSMSDRISSSYHDDEKSSKDLIKRTGERFVAENTPAYSVSITSSGMAALKSISLKQKNSENYEDESVGKRTDNSDLYIDNKVNNNTKESFNQTDDMNVSINKAADEEIRQNNKQDSTLSINNEKSRISDSKMQSTDDKKLSTDDKKLRFINDDSSILTDEKDNFNFVNAVNNSEKEDDMLIEDYDMADDNLNKDKQQPIIEEAIAAYKYQMTYQINAAMFQ